MSLKDLSWPCQEMFCDSSCFSDHSKSSEGTFNVKADEWDGWIAVDNSIQSSVFDTWRQSDEISLYESQSCAMDLADNTQFINHSNAQDDAQFELDDSIILPQFQLQTALRKDYVKRKQLLRGEYHNSHSALPVLEEQRLHSIAIKDYVSTEVTNIEAEERANFAELQPKTQPCRTRPKNLKKSYEPKSNSKCRKQAHNAVERRYRLSLNQKIAELRKHVPSLRGESDEGAEGGDDEENSGTPGYKFGKASILTGAIEYISELEKSTRQLEAEMATLRARVDAFEKLDASMLKFPGVEYGGSGTPFDR